jgi:hypothetical protein
MHSECYVGSGSSYRVAQTSLNSLSLAPKLYTALCGCDHDAVEAVMSVVDPLMEGGYIQSVLPQPCLVYFTCIGTIAQSI